MQQSYNFNQNLFDEITNLHSHLLMATEPILDIHKNYDKLDLFKRKILIKDNRIYTHNHFIAFYKAVIHSVDAIKKIPIPKYDLSDIPNDSNLLFSSFFHFASDLFFCLKSVLIFINKHERSNQSLNDDAIKSLNAIQSIITQCILAISKDRKCCIIDSAFSHFGVYTSSNEVHDPLIFDNSWYNVRLQEYKNFVLNGNCNTSHFFSFELWLFNKHKESGFITNNPCLSCIKGLDIYCAYADSKEMFFNNINDYIIAYFFDFKNRSFKTQSEFVKLNSEKHGEFRYISLIKDEAKELYTQKAVDLAKISSLLDISQETLQAWKNEEHWDVIRKNTSEKNAADEIDFNINYPYKATRLYSTIENVAEVANALLIHATINHPIFLNKERTKIVYTNKAEIEKFTNIIFLISHTFGLKKYSELVPLNETFKKNFALSQELLEKWPGIPFMLYWVSHFIEYKDFKNYSTKSQMHRKG